MGQQVCSRSYVAQELELKALPALSVANVRELLLAAMPLPQLSSSQATRLVVKHLVNRSRLLEVAINPKARNGIKPNLTLSR